MRIYLYNNRKFKQVIARTVSLSVSLFLSLSLSLSLFLSLGIFVTRRTLNILVIVSN